ncbi:MAG: hypothetical protein LBJ67_11000 [Planctomycetaceae bacterium]|jgi:hypothetical protein|nr:hypothetical protein [Planctomycetaceae bacterium]
MKKLQVKVFGMFLVIGGMSAIINTIFSNENVFRKLCNALQIYKAIVVIVFHGRFVVHV